MSNGNERRNYAHYAYKKAKYCVGWTRWRTRQIGRWLITRARDEPFNFVIAIATTVYVIFAAGQWHVMHNQLIVTQKQTAITILQLSPSLKMTLNQGHVLGGMFPYWQFTAQWTNSGQTDALAVRGWSRLKILAPSEVGSFDFRTPPNYFAVETQSKVTNTDSIYISSERINDSEIESAISDKKQILMWGYIEWRDRLPGTGLSTIYWCSQLSPMETQAGMTMNLPGHSAACGLPNNS